MKEKLFPFAAVLALFFGCAEIPDELREEASGKRHYCVIAGQSICLIGFFAASDCRGELSNNCPYSSSEGCENIIFNPSTNFCYEGNIYARCYGMEYNPTTHICQGYAVKPAICGDKLYNPLEQRCQNDVVEIKCGTDWYNPSNQKCENNVVETKCGSGWYDASNSNFRCWSNVIETKCGNLWYNSLAYFCIDGMAVKEGVKEGTFMDVRESKSYKWVKIGTQVWMAENLNYNASDSECGGGNILKDENTINCDNYGRLYNWATAMGIDAKYKFEEWNGSDAKHRDVCPSGWHLPSNAEWRTLTDFVGGSSTAGTKLKATSGWDWSGNGTDDYGFSALPGGNGGSDGYFGNVGDRGYWWSATESSASNAYYQFMYYDFAYVSSSNYFDKSSLYSVRCVQDKA